MRNLSSRSLPILLTLAVLALGAAYYSGLLSMIVGQQDTVTKTAEKDGSSETLPSSDDVIGMVREEKNPVPAQPKPVKKTVPTQVKKKKESPKLERYLRNQECYGPTIEVRLKSRIATGATISLPFKLVATIPYGRLRALSPPFHSSSKEVKAWRDICHEEPFDVGRINLGGLGLDPDKPSTQRVELTPGSTDFPDATPITVMYTPKGIANMPEIPNGFTETEAGLYHNMPENEYGAGMYIAPSSYRTPRGGRLMFRCAPEIYVGSRCSTRYSLNMQKGVTIQYWFYTDHPPDEHMPKSYAERRAKLRFYGGVPQDQWLDLDRRVRQALEGIIIKPAN